MPQPRPNEHGGKFGQGVIVRKYNPGADITIRVELTASHMGYRKHPNWKIKQTSNFFFNTLNIPDILNFVYVPNCERSNPV